MATSDLSRHQIIKILIAQPPEKGAVAAIRLWEQRATQIISIIGEDGFNSLYARSLFLSQAKFPWLSTGSLTPNAVHRFEGLKTSLTQTASAMAEAGFSLGNSLSPIVNIKLLKDVPQMVFNRR